MTNLEMKIFESMLKKQQAEIKKLEVKANSIDERLKTIEEKPIEPETN